jgi:hypothetical protein
LAAHRRVIRKPQYGQRTLRAFGYEWSADSRTWVNREAGRAIGEETLLAWSLGEVRAWLTQGASKQK